MKATITWVEGGVFAATSGSGNAVLMHAPLESGQPTTAPSPMETVLIGTGGCMSVDVVTILQKGRHDVRHCVCRVEAERAENPPKVFTKINMHFVVSGKGLKAEAPAFPWDVYFTAAGAKDLQTINVTHPPCFKEVERLVKTAKPETWKPYLTAHYVLSVVPALPKAFQEERFRFTSRNLTGAKEDVTSDRRFSTGASLARPCQSTPGTFLRPLPVGAQQVPETDLGAEFGGHRLQRRQGGPGHRQAGHVDGDDPFGALGAAVGTASVVEGEPAVRGAAGQVGVDDDHRGRLLRPSVLSARGCMEHRQGLRPRAVA